jgi:hypothetical protein
VRELTASGQTGRGVTTVTSLLGTLEFLVADRRLGNSPLVSTQRGWTSNRCAGRTEQSRRLWEDLYGPLVVSYWIKRARFDKINHRLEQ